MTNKISPYLFPEPQEMQLLGGEISVDLNWQIVVDKDAPEMVLNGAKELVAHIQQASQFKLDVVEAGPIGDLKKVLLVGESFHLVFARKL